MSPTAQDRSGNIRAQERLRSPATNADIHVVLVEPEIPPNTGNVARLCAATRAHLHLVHPLGFDVSEKAVRRAGLDYWHLVQVTEHKSFEAFVSSLPSEARTFYFSGKASRSYLEVSYLGGDYLIFGKESSGLDEAILERYPDDLVGIPTLGAVRSLNLANCVALGVYESLRQRGLLNQATLQPLEQHSDKS